MKTLKIGRTYSQDSCDPGRYGCRNQSFRAGGKCGSLRRCRSDFHGTDRVSGSEFEKDPIKTNLRVIGEEIKKPERLPGQDPGCEYHGGNEAVCGYVKAAVKAGIDLIISGAGLPMELPKLVAGSKTKIAPIVSTVKAAE